MSKGFKLSLRPTVQTKQTLALRQILSPKLIQRYQLFQLSYSDLMGHIERELDDNVYLDVKQSDRLVNQRLTVVSSGSGSDWSDWVVSPDDEANLETYLLKQVDLLGVSALDQAILESLIAGINDRGYLEGYREIQASIMAKHGVDERKVRAMLRVLQGLDPEGVGARTVSECLQIQIEAHDFESEELKELLHRVVTHHLDEIGGGDYGKLAKQLGIDEAGVGAIVQFIKNNLNPTPGYRFGSREVARPIIPSYEVVMEGGELVVTNLESELGIELGMSGHYEAMLHDPLLDDASKQFLLLKQEKARELIDTIQRRRDGLDRLVRVVIEKQRGFFEWGPGYLNPLLQKEVAEVIGYSPSAVSRIVSSKYISTSFGIVPLRQLCPLRVCGTTTKRLEALVSSLCEANPGYSDREIARVLEERGVRIARRTVTKYRLKVGEQSSYVRGK